MKHLIVFLAFLGLSLELRAANGPENAVVVVNADSWASTFLANEYVHARGIPPSHVVALADLPSFETIPVQEFRQRILLPVLKAIEERGLAGQIDYLLYSADFPTAIDVSGDVSKQQPGRVLTQTASLNGLTFLYRPVLARDIRYLFLNANQYARRRTSAARDTPWSDSERQQYVEILRKLQQLTRQRPQRQPKEAILPETKPVNPDPETPLDRQALTRELGLLAENLKTLRSKHPHAAELHYNLACVLASLDRAEEAVAALREAVKEGWRNTAHALRDEDLRPLRQRADFQQLIAQAKDAPIEIQPAVPFFGAAGWSPDGDAGRSDQGERYLLSTMLAYTSGRGNSVPEALASLRRSIAADGTRPSGTVYYLENTDIRSATRAWGFRSAVQKLQQLGVRAVVETGSLPQKKPDVAGAMIGVAGFQWSQCGSTILPGAICEHLTSFGGMLHEGAGQTPLTELIRHGAAGASGTVREPFAIQAKFPTPFIHCFYAQGASLAEAFYLSVAGPYQLLIVGDGLCRPWVRNVTLDWEGPAAGATVRGKVSFLPRPRAGQAFQPVACELYVNGRRLRTDKPGTPLPWDTTQTPDGLHEVSLVSHDTAVGTRAVARLPVEVKNGAAHLEMTSEIPAQLSWDKPLVLGARLPGGKGISFSKDGRELAAIAGSEGRVQIDPRRLGQGPVRIHPVGTLVSGATVLGRTVEITIVPPPALPAAVLPSKAKLVPGFRLSLADKPPQIVARAEGDWLSKNGAGKGMPFTIEAWFEVSEDGVYQFQLRGDARTLAIDGVRQDWPRGKEWWFMPIPLARGHHRLRLEGQAGERPSLDVRFGGRGSLRLDGSRFQHEEQRSREEKGTAYFIS
jgi:tetratricopeptide (TPR) repeat protein